MPLRAPSCASLNVDASSLFPGWRAFAQEAYENATDLNLSHVTEFCYEPSSLSFLLPCLMLIFKEHIWPWKYLSGHCERVWLLKIFTQSVSRRNESNVLLWDAFRPLWRSMSTKIDTQYSINLQLIKTGQIHIPLSGRMECRQFP